MPKFGFINIEKEVDDLLDEFGDWVAIRSIDFSQPTHQAQESVKDNYEQSNPDFQHIVANYPYVDKLVRGRRYLAQPGFDFQTQVGVLNTKLQVYIIASDKYPKNTDYILELYKDENTGVVKQPFQINRVWKIQDAQPMRGGQPVKHPAGIEFFRCFVEEDNIGYSNKPT